MDQFEGETPSRTNVAGTEETPQEFCAALKYVLVVFVAGDECTLASSVASTDGVSMPLSKRSRIGVGSAVGRLDQLINLRVLDLSRNKLSGENDARRQTFG